MIRDKWTRNVLMGMRKVYDQGGNVMEWVRDQQGATTNPGFATLVAYDLQAGSYVSVARAQPDFRRAWTQQVAGLLAPYVTPGGTLLEAGSGEATTMSGVLESLAPATVSALGCDGSWSRVAMGQQWLRERDLSADLFVGDFFELPLADDSVDVVYTSHSIEPNRGREREALVELFRVARRALVVVEPIYELATPEGRARMDRMAYAQGLIDAAVTLGGRVVQSRLLEVTGNPLNPSGVIVIEKEPGSSSAGAPTWQCPTTGVPLEAAADGYRASDAGLVYPVLRGVPLLRRHHAVVATHFPALGGYLQ